MANTGLVDLALFRDFTELCRHLDAAGAERLILIVDEEPLGTTKFRIVT